MKNNIKYFFENIQNINNYNNLSIPIILSRYIYENKILVREVYHKRYLKKYCSNYVCKRKLYKSE
jgi:hypothetical protein